MNTVYILESPSDIDLVNERREGEALSKALKLQGTEVKYFLVTTMKSLLISLGIIKDDFLKMPNNITALPFLHLSAHGNENGFSLCTSEFVTWNKFNSILSDLNKSLGYISFLDKKKLSRIVLCMSVCKGLYAFENCKENPKPFQAVIGNSSPVSWSEALTGFLVFYYNAIIKQLSFEESVERMNLATSPKVKFKIILDTNLQ